MPLAPLDNRPALPDGCGIRGCGQAVSTYFDLGPGRWAAKCHLCAVTGEGSLRTSYHRGFWDQPTGQWHWTTRGFSETVLAKLSGDLCDNLVELSELPHKRYPLLQYPSANVQAGVLPEAEGTGCLVALTSNIQVPPKDTGGQEDVGVAAGPPDALVTHLADSAELQAGLSTRIDEPSAVVCPPDPDCGEREVATPVRCNSLSLPSPSPASSSATPSNENSQATPVEDASGSDEDWSTGGRGRKGCRREDCRLCRTPRAGDVQEQRGQFCWACKDAMRKFKRRKTSHLICPDYRRSVLEESVLKRQEARGEVDGCRGVQGCTQLDQQVECRIEPCAATCIGKGKAGTVPGPSPKKHATGTDVFSGPSGVPAARHTNLRAYTKCGDLPATLEGVDPVATSWGKRIPCPPTIHIDRQKRQLCAVHALRNVIQDVSGDVITEDLLVQGAKLAAKRLGDDLSLHQCVRGAGNFSIEAVAEAVMLTAGFSMRCLGSLSAVWDGLPAVTVVEQAFASAEGLQVAGLLVHSIGHYVALLPPGTAGSTQVLLLDSLHPTTVELVDPDSFKTKAVRRKPRRQTTKRTREPCHRMFQILKGKSALYDERSLAHAMRGSTFGPGDTPGKWVDGVWVPGKGQ